MTNLAVVTRVGHRRRVSAIGTACAAIACATVGCARAKIATDIAPKTPFAVFIAADSMRDSASKLVANHLLSAGAALYLHAGESDAAKDAPGQSFYDAADAYLAAGMIDASISALNSAVRAGYHDSAGLRDDTALVALHADPRWSNVVTGVVRNEHRFRQVHSDPNRVLISTTDITRFWTAYDLAAKEPTIDARSGVYLREYVEPGSRGLHDFYAKKIRSSKRLAETVEKYPRFYASMRDPTLHLSNLAPTIRSVFRRMKQLYPETIYPDIYFVMGRISSAGTVADYGLLFGAEQNVASADTPVDELPLVLQRIVFQRADLPHTIAHELVHFQQHLADKHTLLDVALIEGGATFLSDLAVPDRPPPYFLTWGAAHERQVWTAFARDMEHDDVSQWIGNNGTTSRPDWPADLGYFVGYQISRAYYERASNKLDAIRDLIVLRDSEAILRESHYAAAFR